MRWFVESEYHSGTEDTIPRVLAYMRPPNSLQIAIYAVSKVSSHFWGWNPSRAFGCMLWFVESSSSLPQYGDPHWGWVRQDCIQFYYHPPYSVKISSRGWEWIAPLGRSAISKKINRDKYRLFGLFRHFSLSRPLEVLSHFEAKPFMSFRLYVMICWI